MGEFPRKMENFLGKWGSVPKPVQNIRKNANYDSATFFVTDMHLLLQNLAWRVPGSAFERCRRQLKWARFSYFPRKTIDFPRKTDDFSDFPRKIVPLQPPGARLESASRGPATRYPVGPGTEPLPKKRLGRSSIFFEFCWPQFRNSLFSEEIPISSENPHSRKPRLKSKTHHPGTYQRCGRKHMDHVANTEPTNPTSRYADAANRGLRFPRNSRDFLGKSTISSENRHFPKLGISPKQNISLHVYG